ncbi:MAG TPA: amidase [Chitinophagales bacterium]|nr:amidase [Chitinophagales bacterium]
MKQINTFDIGILQDWDAIETAKKIKDKSIHAEEAVSCAVERAERADVFLNAIVNANYKKALEEAKVNHKGIFAGVPTFIKDLNDVEGFPTLKGSAAFKNKPAKKNDKIVNQILDITGAVILGKTSTSEFGLLPCGETLQHGETRNPWNIAYSTGGSSAGAAALVASGVVPFAHASDGGGSIRIPASCCGLIGLKPTRGRNCTSTTEKAPVDVAQDGILARSVRDVALYYSKLTAYSQNKKLPEIGLVTHPGKKRLKIGMFTQSSLGITAQADVENTVEATGKLLEDMGHQVSYISNPFEHKVTRDFLMYWSFLSFASMITEYAANGLDYRHSKTAKFTKQLAAAFPFLSIASFSSIRNLQKHIQDYNTILEDFDVLLSPTLSHPAPPIGHFGTEVDALEIVMKLNAYVNFTTTQNITGAPAISLPMGISSDGLPIGVQLATGVGDEHTLLELAYELEETNSFKMLHLLK